eukprot:10334766-Alexandrium_andersonii.AAC.1
MLQHLWEGRAAKWTGCVAFASKQPQAASQGTRVSHLKQPPRPRTQDLRRAELAGPAPWLSQQQ